MRFVAVTAIIILAGGLIFVIYANFDTRLWNTLYYIWAAVKDLCAAAIILYLIPKPKRWIWRPVFYYSIIRLSWELTAAVTKWDINYPAAVDSMFIVILTGLSMLLLKDLALSWKRKY